MAQDIKDLIDAIKQEAREQDETIKSFIKTELQSTKINYNQLDDTLKSLIMAKPSQGGQPAPVPSGKLPIPTDKADEGIVIDSTFRKVVDDLLSRNNVYLYGKAGTGKTRLAVDVAKYLKKGEKQYSYELNCSQWTSPIQIIGGWSIRGYQEGQLELAWKYGGLLILDELPKLDANTAGLLNAALSETAGEAGEVFITNGRGEKIPKHKDFMVIGTGNTDLKSTELKFSGNNRQDYSLVDRFVGSMYMIGYNYALEKRLLYTAVYNIGQGIRNFIDVSPDSIEAVTLRSMLNWNRTYQLEMLRNMRSPDAWNPAGLPKGSTQGKTLRDSIDSFINTLGTDRASRAWSDIKVDDWKSQGASFGLGLAIDSAIASDEIFTKEFIDKYGQDPETGEKA
jgi:cobaltochelatase CobS